MNGINLLNEREVAELLGVQTKTLSSWRCRGTGPAFTKIGRLVKYLQADLEDYVKTQRRQSTSASTDRRRKR